MHYLACVQHDFACTNHHISAGYIFVLLAGAAVVLLAWEALRRWWRRRLNR